MPKPSPKRLALAALASLGALVVSSPPVQASAVSLTVYHHPQLISSPAQARRYLHGTSPSFQRYAGRLGRTENRQCGPGGGRGGIKVNRYDSRGFAALEGGQCWDVYGEIAVHANGRWLVIPEFNRGQQAPMCADLWHYHVPDRVLDTQPATCEPTSALGQAVPYVQS